MPRRRHGLMEEEASDVGKFQFMISVSHVFVSEVVRVSPFNCYSTVSNTPNSMFSAHILPEEYWDSSAQRLPL